MTNERDKSKGTVRTDATLSFGMANFLAVPLFVVALGLLLVPYVAVWGSGWTHDIPRIVNTWTMLAGLVVGIVLHELLHGLGWKFFGKAPWSAIRFGVRWTLLTPFAHCKVQISAKAYRIGTMLPGVVTGVLPGVIGIILGNPGLTILGGFLFGAAGGDILALWVMRSVPSHTPVRDHPTRVGCEVLADSVNGSARWN